MRNLSPLMTSGKYDERWVPPRRAFITYEAKDEGWARPLGIGRVVMSPAKLYDVRDRRGALIGYTGWDPTESMGIERVEILSSGMRLYSPRGRGMSPPDLRTVEIETRVLGIDRERYLTWVANLEDAEDLIRTGWITMGEDNMNRMIHSVRERAMNQRIDRRY